MARKKIILTAALATAAYVGVKKVADNRAEADLWAEAVDPVPAPPLD